MCQVQQKPVLGRPPQETLETFLDQQLQLLINVFCQHRVPKSEYNVPAEGIPPFTLFLWIENFFGFVFYYNTRALKLYFPLAWRDFLLLPV